MSMLEKVEVSMFKSVDSDYCCLQVYVKFTQSHAVSTLCKFNGICSQTLQR